MPMPAFRLEADWNPEIATPGQLTITLINTGTEPVKGFTLAITSLFRIKPDAPIQGAKLVEQLSNYHVLAPRDGLELAPGGRWEIVAREIATRTGKEIWRIWLPTNTVQAAIIACSRASSVSFVWRSTRGMYLISSFILHHY